MGKAKTKKTSVKDVRRAITTAAAFLAAVYLVVTLLNGQIRLRNMQTELETLQVSTELQRGRNSELESLLSTGNEDAFVQRIARERFQYVMPGERIYVDITGQ